MHFYKFQMTMDFFAANYECYTWCGINISFYISFTQYLVMQKQLKWIYCLQYLQFKIFIIFLVIQLIRTAAIILKLQKSNYVLIAL